MTHLVELFKTASDEAKGGGCVLFLSESIGDLLLKVHLFIMSLLHLDSILKNLFLMLICCM